MSPFAPRRLVAAAVLAFSLLGPRGVVPDDCNDNGTEDALDLRFGFDSLRSETVGREATLADLNDDGLPDLAGLAGLGVAVRLNAGDGTFGEAALHEGQRDTLRVAGVRLVVADFNGDGTNDLVSLGPKDAATSTAIMFGNRGNGTFNSPLRSLFSSFVLRKGGTALAVELNNDGRSDLVVVSEPTDWDDLLDLTILLNRGIGAFEEHATYKTLARSLAAAHLDGDELTDLAMLDRLAVTVLWGPGGEGGTGRTELRRYGAFPESLSLVIADFNADGKLDLASTSFVDSALFLLNLDAREFQGDTIQGLNGRSTGADLNGDGATDLVAYFNGRVSVLLSHGDGTFAPVVEFEILSEVQSVEAADLNGDGRAELLAAADDELGVFWSQEGGGFLAREDFYAFPPANRRVIDVNGDGKPDITGQSGEAISILFNQGARGFAGAFGYRAAADRRDNVLFLAAADLDGDGRPDLATVNRDFDSVSVLLNDGDARFREPTRYPAGDEPFSLITADFDGDEETDLAALNYAPRAISVLRNAGGGTFEAPVSHPIGGPPLAFTAADFNGDGRPDLATSHHLTSNVSVLLNDGGGGFGGATNHAVGEHPLSLIAADLDGDGKPDLATGNFTSGSVSVLWNDGAGAFETAPALEVGVHPVALVAADLDGDGNADLAAANFGSRNVSVLINAGGGGFQAAAHHPVEAIPNFLAAADLDLDGKLDLASAGRDSGSLSILFGEGGGSFTAKVYPAGGSWGTLTVADLDGNGSGDLIRGAAPHRGSVEALLNLGGRSFQTAWNYEFGALHPLTVVTDLDGDADADLVLGYGTTIYGNSVLVLRNHTSFPHSFDGNGNGIPDECEHQPFHRGDANRDGRNDVSDAIAVLDFLFSGGEEPGCLEAADSNNDGALNITDPILLFNYLFLGDDPPPAPGPAPNPCGLDPDPAGSRHSLGCAGYDAC